MIKVIKDFYKLSEKKTYKKGSKVEFSKAVEDSLIKEGFADKIVVKKVKK